MPRYAWRCCSILTLACLALAAAQPEVTLLEVGGENLKDVDKVALRRLDEAAGESIRFEGWAILPESKVCAIVNLRDSATARAYCAVEDLGEGVYRIPNVRFGEEDRRARAYTIRVAVFSESPPGGDFPLDQWLSKALVRSESRVVEIAARPEIPACILLSTIGGRAVDSGESMLVDDVADVAGGLSCPRADENAAVYVLSCPHGAGRCRVLGPAERSGQSWIVRGAELNEPGEPYQTHHRVLAIWTPRPIDAKYIASDRVETYAGRASASVGVKMRPRPIAEVDDAPVVRIERFVAEGRAVSPGSAPQVQTALETLREISGSVERMPVSGGIWLGFMDADNRIMIVGPALIERNRWVTPIARNTAARLPSAARLFAFVSTRKALPTQLPYTEVHDLLLGHSPWITFAANGPEKASAQAGALTLESAKVFAAGNALHLQAWGTQSGLSEEGFLCLGVGDASRGLRVHCSTTCSEGRWESPTLDVSDERGRSVRSARTLEAIALWSETRPPEWLPLEEIRNYGSVHSQLATLRWNGTGQASWSRSSGLGGVAMYSLIVLASVLILVLGWLAFRPRRLLSPADPVGGRSRLSEHFSGVADAKFDSASVLGVMLGLVGITAMFLYFPLYCVVLQTVFGMPLAAASALTCTLMIFTGLAGVLFHLVVEYTRSAARVFLGTLVLLVTASLWALQGTVYFRYYITKNPDVAVAGALGVAGFFVSAIETLLFYFALRLGLKLGAFLLCLPVVARMPHGSGTPAAKDWEWEPKTERKTDVVGKERRIPYDATPKNGR